MLSGRMVVTFCSGIFLGICGQYLVRALWERTNAQERDTKSYLDGHDIEGKIEGKIQLFLSAADNAINILEDVLPKVTDHDIKASIKYALNVLKSDLSNASVPVGLDSKPEYNTTMRRCSAISNESEVVVLDWLVSSYTRKTSTFNQGNQGASQKIKLNLKFRGAQINYANDGNYIYDVSPDELEKLHHALDGVDNWDWDVWKLYSVSKGRPLQTLGWHLLHKWGLMAALNLDPHTVKCWLKFVESMYQDAQYHSATHAADVLQAVNHFLGQAGAAEYLSTIRVFALLIAAIMHDVGHDGKNNVFHENAMTERALMFNDQSIQENFHCMTIFSSMSKNPNLNILAPLGRDQAKEVRRLVVLMTLGTDMKLHFKHCQKYRSLVSTWGRNKLKWIADPDASDALCVNLLHAADLSNPCRQFDVARLWAIKVLNEFFAQGDVELRMGLPVSPMCSRDTTLVPASQIGFISFIVLPYFQVLRETFPHFETLTERLETNLQRWKTEEAAGQIAVSSNGSSTPDSTPPPAHSDVPEHSDGMQEMGRQG